MATPRTLTYQQMDDLFASTPCKGTIDARNDYDSGWEPGDSVDVYTYMEAMYDRGDGYNTILTAVHGMTSSEKAAFINWAMNQIISITPGSYSRKSAMSNLKEDLIDYVSAPTAGKRTALINTANAIKPVTSEAAELWVANAFRGITLAVASNNVTGTTLERFTVSLARAAIRIGGYTKDQIVRATLTKIEEILDLVDP